MKEKQLQFVKLLQTKMAFVGMSTWHVNLPLQKKTTGDKSKARYCAYSRTNGQAEFI